jgi:hypothetical protein
MNRPDILTVARQQLPDAIFNFHTPLTPVANYRWGVRSIFI